MWFVRWDVWWALMRHFLPDCHIWKAAVCVKRNAHLVLNWCEAPLGEGRPKIHMVNYVIPLWPTSTNFDQHFVKSECHVAFFLSLLCGTFMSQLWRDFIPLVATKEWNTWPKSPSRRRFDSSQIKKFHVFLLVWTHKDIVLVVKLLLWFYKMLISMGLVFLTVLEMRGILVTTTLFTDVLYV